MWSRNLLFAGVSLVGCAVLGFSLSPTNRVPEPTGFEIRRADGDELRQVVQRVDAEFRQHWQIANLPTAERASDLSIARRLSLGLTGTVPSLEEIRRIESKPAEERIQWWLSRLFEDRRFADYVAERLARSYVGVENGPFIRYRRDRLVRWLSDQLAENVRYDQLVRELLADSGLWTSSPAVNFVSVTINDNEGGKPDPIRLAARTAREFLGMRIDCLQCHDNNLPDEYLLGTGDQVHDGTQQDFHQLAAFFSEVQTTFRGMQDQKGKEYQFEYLYEDEPQVVPAVFPCFQNITVEGETRRERLASWVTHPDNKAFSRAIVNRVWALMFGQPLTEQVDNIPLYGYRADQQSTALRAAALMSGDPTSLPLDDLPVLRHAKGQSKYRWWSGEAPFPPALESLADDFVKNDFDLRRLIRVIASSQAFQLQGAFDAASTQRQRDGWAVFPVTRLRPEQVAGAIIQATSLTTIDERASIISKLARYFQENEFVKRYGDLGEEEFALRGGTIPQRFELMNGSLPHQRTKFSPLLLNAASAVSRLAPDDRTAVETIYLATWSRRPQVEHLDFFEKALAGKTGRDRVNEIQDLYWGLFNARRFAWNH